MPPRRTSAERDRAPILCSIAIVRRVAVSVLLLALFAAACGDAGPKTPIDEGRSIYGDVCSVCHGKRGEGGVGPALASVAATFPDCTDHIEWITLGSDGWKETYGDEYGANGTPVAGGMPAQGDALTTEQIALVAAFERVEYAGNDEAEALASCGVPAAP